MNRVARRNSTRKKSALLGAGLITTSMIGYMAIGRTLPVFANENLSCVVNDNRMDGGDATDRTLRYCIANTDEFGTITFDSSIKSITFAAEIGLTPSSSLSTSALTANQQPFTIDKSLTIVGNSTATTVSPVINGIGSYQLFRATAGTLTLKNLGLSNGYSDEYGGAVLAESENDPAPKVNVILDGVSLKGNESQYGGGAIDALGDVTVIKSGDVPNLFSNNTGINGGAIYALGDVIIGEALFDANEASRGGAIFAEGNVSTGLGSVFQNGIASVLGGAIRSEGTTTVNGSVFKDNQAYAGGAISSGAIVTLGGAILSEGRTTIHDVAYFGGNGATVSGGAIFAIEVVINGDSEFRDHSVFDVAGNPTEAQSGGAVYSKGTTTITGDPIFVGNTAQSAGGAMFSAEKITATGNLSFRDNEADFGGAVYATAKVELTGQQYFQNNTAGDSAAAIFSTGEVEIISTATGKSLFSNNDANTDSGFGGAIQADELGAPHVDFKNNDAGDGGAFFVESSAAIYDSYFGYNTAISGGAIYSDGMLIVKRSYFKENTASNGSGGAIAATTLDPVNIEYSQFASNTAASSGVGGAMATSSTSFNILGSSFNGNIAYSGGAVYGVDLYVKQSSFEENVAATGGAIQASSQASISQSYFKSNTAHLAGGAVFSRGFAGVLESLFVSNSSMKGGAINSDYDSLVVNSTFYKNSASDGAAIYTDTFAEVIHSTIVLNYILDGTAGINSAVYAASADIGGSIIQGNLNLVVNQDQTETTSAGTDLLITGESVAIINSIFSSAGSAIFGAQSTAVGNENPDQESILFGDPGLSALADNGGPTHSMLPLADSIAIDNGFLLVQPQTGDPNLFLQMLLTDQLGQPRVSGSASDIGAVEPQQSQTPAPSFSSPAPTALPILTLVDAGPYAVGETVFGRVSNTDSVTSLSIAGVEVTEISLQDGVLSFLVPDIDAGVYSITGVFDSGELTFDVGLSVSEEVLGASQELAVWTKKISDTEIKLYAKNLVSAGKIQFFHNGNEVAWVRAESEADPKLRTANGSSYLVRTRELMAGKNVFEIFVDGERVRRTVYSSN